MTPRTAKIGCNDPQAARLESRHPAPLNSPHAAPRLKTCRHFITPRVLLRAHALGLVAGLASACVSINDGWWGDAQQACFDDYEECVEDIESLADAAACEELLDVCLKACDEVAGDDDEHEPPSEDSGSSTADDGDDEDPPHTDEGGDGDEGDDPPRTDEGGDDDDPPRAEEGGDGDGDGGDGDGDGDTGDRDGDQPDPACFSIHATCVAEAETLQDIEACETLFDNCIDPGPCESDECEPGCPQAQLDECVSGYADCAVEALTAEQVLDCAAEFDCCIAEFDVGLCLPNYDDDLLNECLDQHDLCIACADGAEEIAACKVAFDNCLEI